MEAAISYTPSEPKAESLTGKFTRLWPYVRGYYGRGFLGDLWRIMEEEGAAADIFYPMQSISPTTPVDTRGDIVDFCSYFSSPDRRLFVVECLQDLAVVGWFWLDEMVKGQRATVSLFFRKRYRGRIAFDAAMIFREHVVHDLGFPEIWGVTPHRHSALMGRALGMREMGRFPAFQRMGDSLVDLYVLRYKE